MCLWPINVWQVVVGVCTQGSQADGLQAAGAFGITDITVRQEIEERLGALRGKMDAIRQGDEGAIQRSHRNGSEASWHFSTHCWNVHVLFVCAFLQSIVYSLHQFTVSAEIPQVDSAQPRSSMALSSGATQIQMWPPALTCCVDLAWRCRLSPSRRLLGGLCTNPLFGMPHHATVGHCRGVPESSRLRSRRPSSYSTASQPAVKTSGHLT